MPLGDFVGNSIECDHHDQSVHTRVVTTSTLQRQCCLWYAAYERQFRQGICLIQIPPNSWIGVDRNHRARGTKRQRINRKAVDRYVLKVVWKLNHPLTMGKQNNWNTLCSQDFPLPFITTWFLLQSCHSPWCWSPWCLLPTLLLHGSYTGWHQTTII